MASQNSLIDIHLAGLGEILSRGPWQVPPYQRAYAWEAEHVQKLFSDVDDAVSRGEEEYFLGSIVIKKAKEGGVSEIVDGQQRLATAAILLAAIRDFFFWNNDKSRSESIEKQYLFNTNFRTQERSPKLTLNGSDHSFYYDTILEPPDGVNRARKPEKNRTSEHNLRAAKNLAREYVNQLAGPQKNPNRLFDLEEYIGASAKGIWVTVPDDTNAYMVFEVLNARGLDLAISDLLKNQLFRVSLTNLEQVKENWIGMTAVLEAVADEIVVDFIRHFWSSTYGLTRDKQLFEAFKANVTDKKSALSFSQIIKAEASTYAAILSVNHPFWTTQSASSRDYMDILNRRLGMTRMRPLLLAILSTFTKKIEVEKALRFLVAASVRFLITGGGGAGSTEQAYAQHAKAIRDKAITNAQQLAAAMKNLVPTDSQFQDAFKIASVSKSKPARYYLQTLERQQSGDAQPEWVVNENEGEINLEHVMPQTPGHDWKKVDPDVLRAYTKRIGNLALVKAGINSQFGNETFTVKKAALNQSSLSLSKMIATEAQWTSKEIQARQEKLAALAVKAWPAKV